MISVSVSQKKIHIDRRVESASVISVSVSQKKIHSDRRVESASVISVSVSQKKYTLTDVWRVPV